MEAIHPGGIWQKELKETGISAAELRDASACRPIA